MASRDATIEKRVRAVARIQKALGIQFRQFKGGPEHQHAADLEAIADALERQAASRQPRTLKAEKAEEAAAE